MAKASKSKTHFGVCRRAHSSAFVSKFVILWMVLCAIFRVGEALVPGPSWGLGTINPNSLLGKAHQMNSLPKGVYAISESSLTSPGVWRSRQELQQVDNQSRLLAGHPAPARSRNSMRQAHRTWICFSCSL